MGKVYRTVLFDGDNTLLDFDAAERQAVEKTLAARGFDPTPERVRAYAQINRALWDALYRGEVEQGWLVVERFRRLGKMLESTADPEAWNLEYTDALGECGAMLPGALELLETLRPHCAIALVTNGQQAVQRKRLRDHPMLPYLDGVFISQELGVRKPEAAFFQTAITALGADPGTTLVVGDDLLSDIQGAVNAGLDSLWYAPHGGDSPLPTYRVRSLEEIPPIVLGRA